MDCSREFEHCKQSGESRVIQWELVIFELALCLEFRYVESAVWTMDDS